MGYAMPSRNNSHDLVALLQLSSLKLSSLQLYTDPLVSTLLPLLVEEPEKMHEITNQFATLWTSLYTRIPFELAIKTLNALAPQAQDDSPVAHIGNKRM